MGVLAMLEDGIRRIDLCHPLFSQGPEFWGETRHFVRVVHLCGTMIRSRYLLCGWPLDEAK